MEEIMQTALPNDTYLCRLSRNTARYRRSLVPLVAGLGSLLILSHPSGFLGSVAVFMFFLIYGVRTDAHITLLVSPDGIEYHLPQRTITADWRDVERIGYLHNRWRRWQIGEGLWLTGYRVTVGLPTTWRFADAFVPLEWLVPDWRASALGDDIRRYAPWLITRISRGMEQ